RRGRIPPMIVVGVANTRRDRDLTPLAAVTTHREEMLALGTTVSMDIEGSGGAEGFRTFLKTELMPWVDRQYRTADFQILAGHSFGGLFAVDSFAADPDLFDAYIAASPSLWWDDQALVRRLGQRLPDLSTPRWLYLTTGSEEGGAMLGSLDQLAAVLEISAPTSLRWSAGVLGGATHIMAPHQAFYDGLLWVFADYALSERVTMTGDIARIEAHFADASRTYGVDFSPPEDQVNSMGYTQLMVFHDPARAVEIFRRNIALHPASANARDSLADGLEAMGQPLEGLREREEAVRLGTASNDPLLEMFQTNLAQARERIAGEGQRTDGAR
ncbi:MAG TPA: alpha/beta hydrolase-fold protein, partial [Caulobacteraceae bacterium]|nr:alpha/beta hydrolase-fold protein [Caulobacteraceae bacterium]